jgi:opacity protein-like surface antigen
MRSTPFRQLAWSAAAAAIWAATPAPAAELYLAGELGIASLSGDGTGTNDLVGITNSGSSNDASPVYGGALGIVFPLNAALPWHMRIPGFAVPYWPGRQLRFHGGEDVRFPDWGVRVEVEYLRGRDVDLSTQSFNALEPYRSDVESWSVMGKLRMDVPVRAPLYAMVGRVPFLDPLTLYGGGGAGIGVTDLAVGTGVLSGSDHAQEFGWQAIAGIGYQMTDRVKWSIGWRFYDLGEVETRLIDAAFTDRGSYSIELQAHEFTTSLSLSFWRLPFLGES